jgi:hypothetical protein
LERETLQAKWPQNPLHEIEASSKPRNLKMSYMKKSIERKAGEHKVKVLAFVPGARNSLNYLYSEALRCITWSTQLQG